MGIKYKIKRNFFKIWSKEMSYILGFIVADGSLEDASYLRGKYLRLYSNDVEILEKIKQAMHSEHKIIARSPSKFLYNGKKYISNGNYMVRIGNHEIYNDLIKLGVTPRKSKTIKFPQVPLQYLSHFIRGYLDGDGCIYSYKTRDRLSVVFTSGSKMFLQALSQVISSSYGTKEHNIACSDGVFQLMYSTKEAVKLLNSVYTESANNLFLNRKFQKYSDFIKKYPKYISYKNEKVMAW